MPRASRDGPDRSMRHGSTPDGGRGPAQQLPLRPLACPGLTLVTPAHPGPPEPPSHAARHSRDSAKLSDGPFGARAPRPTTGEGGRK